MSYAFSLNMKVGILVQQAGRLCGYHVLRHGMHLLHDRRCASFCLTVSGIEHLRGGTTAAVSDHRQSCDHPCGGCRTGTSDPGSRSVHRQSAGRQLCPAPDRRGRDRSAAACRRQKRPRLVVAAPGREISFSSGSASPSAKGFWKASAIFPSNIIPDFFHRTFFHGVEETVKRGEPVLDLSGQDCVR